MNAKNKCVTVAVLELLPPSLPTPPTSPPKAKANQNPHLLPVLRAELHIEQLSDKQSGLSIWPYCFPPLISWGLTVLMRKQMQQAANCFPLASEQKKTQHLIESFDLQQFGASKMEIFYSGTWVWKRGKKTNQTKSSFIYMWMGAHTRRIWSPSFNLKQQSFGRQVNVAKDCCLSAIWRYVSWQCCRHWWQCTVNSTSTGLGDGTESSILVFYSIALFARVKVSCTQVQISAFLLFAQTSYKQELAKKKSEMLMLQLWKSLLFSLLPVFACYYANTHNDKDTHLPCLILFLHLLCEAPEGCQRGFCF